jgi:FkbM family methyltransferase
MVLSTTVGRARREARWVVERTKVAVQVVMLLGPVCALRLFFVHRLNLRLSRTGAQVKHECSPVRIRVRGVNFPLLVRPLTSDLFVFNQIFVDREYAPLDDIDVPSRIVDAGANVGYSSAHFLSRFPAAHVIALEPDPDNAEMCRRNLEPYGDRARVLVRAVWPYRANLTILHFGDLGDRAECGVQVIEGSLDLAALPDHVHRDANLPVPSGEVEGMDLAAVIDMAGGPIDLLKMDIERAECLVFGDDAAASWLRQVSNIAIELHGSNARKVFFQALEGFSYESVDSGELTICLNIRPRPITQVP